MKLLRSNKSRELHRVHHLFTQDHHHQATYPFWNNESLPFMVLVLSSEEARSKSVFSINFRRCWWRCLLDRWSCRSNRSPRVYRASRVIATWIFLFFFLFFREKEKERERERERERRREREREKERERKNISNKATSFLVARAVAPSRETLRDRAEKEQERATERRATLSSPSFSARYRAIRNRFRVPTVRANSRRRLVAAVPYHWPISFFY